MDRLRAYDNCIKIFNSCWDRMQNTEQDWDKAVDAFGKVCQLFPDAAVREFALECIDLLERKFKEARAGC